MAQSAVTSPKSWILEWMPTRRRCLLWPLLLLTAIESFAYYTLTNVLTLHLTDLLGISDATAGAHFGLRGTVSVIFSTLGGPVIDAFGPRRVLPFAFALAAIGRIVFALATEQRMALAAMYGPMAAGHGLTNAALTICVKRATSEQGGPTAAWGFALQYCALVLGITACGPTIDVATSYLAPTLPYRALALLSGGCSVLGLCASLILLATAGAHPATTTIGTGTRGGGGAAAHSDGVDSAHLPNSTAAATQAVVGLRRTLCTQRFARFAAFSIAILPACTVLRNLDGGIFPKFMLRKFGPVRACGSSLTPPNELLMSTLDLPRSPSNIFASRSHHALPTPCSPSHSALPHILLSPHPALALSRAPFAGGAQGHDLRPKPADRLDRHPRPHAPARALPPFYADSPWHECRCRLAAAPCGARTVAPIGGRVCVAAHYG